MSSPLPDLRSAIAESGACDALLPILDVGWRADEDSFTKAESESDSVPETRLAGGRGCPLMINLVCRRRVSEVHGPLQFWKQCERRAFVALLVERGVQRTVTWDEVRDDG